MQVHLHTDHHFEGHEAIAHHADSVVADALARFADQVTRVEAHIGDGEGHARSNPGGVRCMLEARLNGLPPITVTDHAATVHQAIGGAAGKLERAVDSALGRHAARRAQPVVVDAAPDEA
jgi:ribosome-associated translation inhibitor RaiA